MTAAAVFADRLRDAAQSRRHIRMRVMVGRGCNTGVTLDYTKRAAEKSGTPGGWLLTVCCAKTNALLGRAIFPDTKFETAKRFLQTIAARENFNAVFVVIDDVPLRYIDTIFTSGYIEGLKEVFKVEAVYQDRFHVLKNFSDHFNNMHPLYHELIIVGVRDATVVRNNELEQEVDLALREGRVSINKT